MEGRIRYGRIDGHPKNTLYTFQEDDVVYFGISRCNQKYDNFVKRMGISIAANRAELAYDEGDDYYVDQGNIRLHCNSGLRGNVSVEYVGELITYFKEIDRHSLDRVINATRPETITVANINEPIERITRIYGVGQ